MNPKMHKLLVQVGIYIEPRKAFEWHYSGEAPDFLESDRDFLEANGPAIVELLEGGGLERLVALALQKQRDLNK
ncbi:MAG: hypothetical protein ACK5PR_03335 [bacterium]|jgi:hypothetical protein